MTQNRTKDEEEENRKYEEKGLKELKQKPISDSYYPPSPQYMPSSEGNTATPALTDTLVPAPKQEEEEKPVDKEDKDTDYDSDDAITIIRAEYV